MMIDLYDKLIASIPILIFMGAVIAIAMVVLERLFVRDELNTRMKAILTERERIRQRERLNLPNGKKQSNIQAFLAECAHRAKLTIWLLDTETQTKLMRAGLRDTNARSLFLVARLSGILGPSVCLLLYCLLAGHMSYIVAVPAVAWLGLRMSSYTLERKAEARDKEMTSVAPDIVDLLTICVESGMSIELALQRVAEEMGRQSVVAADELSVTAAELSYVQKRSDAFANLVARTGSKPIQNLCISLIQADSYGTSIATTLRLQSAEARKLRQLEAERRALAIPPKLSVVMVFFFMPVIMIVMLYPAISKMSGMNFSL